MAFSFQEVHQVCGVCSRIMRPEAKLNTSGKEPNSTFAPVIVGMYGQLICSKAEWCHVPAVRYHQREWFILASFWILPLLYDAKDEEGLALRLLLRGLVATHLVRTRRLRVSMFRTDLHQVSSLRHGWNVETWTTTQSSETLIDFLECCLSNVS